MADKKVEKGGKKWRCEICDYKTSRSDLFTKHLSTVKHKKLQNTYKYLQNTSEKVEKVAKNENDEENDDENIEEKFYCRCGRSYKHRQSLFKHQNNCDYEEKEPSGSGVTEEQVCKLISQNTEMMLNSFNTIIKEIAPQIGTQNNNTINNNQRFNINVFLNEQCKDAMNMSDFIKSIEVSLQQLDLTKTMGLEQGITNVIMENMSRLSVYERPIHCTDTKRETLYIKDGDKWEKDKDKTKIKHAIKKTSGKNYDALVKWTKENPDFMDSDDKQRYYALALSKLGKPLDGIDDKVIKKICNSTYIKDDLNDEI
tara:strand:+ start:484 stop:1419 length:936 start_codon:yes stop_codon:yes gene_type:complete